MNLKFNNTMNLNKSNLPNMANTILNWRQFVNLKKVVKDNTMLFPEGTENSFDFSAIIIPLNLKQLEMKLEGQRQFQWFQLYITNETYIKKCGISISEPAIITLNNHNFNNTQNIFFKTNGELPSGINLNTSYFTTKIDANTFLISDSFKNYKNNIYVNTNGTQTGIHSLFIFPFLELNDVVIYENNRYIVLSSFNYNDYGYIEYHICNEFTN